MNSAEPSQSSRFVVGLDLGTTNSALAFVDTQDKTRRIQTLLVPQVVAPGVIEPRETLPSFLYQPATGEFTAESLRLPWGESPAEIVGQFARDHGTLVPGRLISSAKSWLCHNGVDRTADLLPWQGAEDVQRMSPVTVSSRYLEHFRQAWDAQFPEYPLADQDFVLTIPASFDEVARELTIRAARQAGLQRVVLIEEPQAAFYAWIDKNSQTWNQLVTPGQNILICDVGGGTTDFTLIRVRSGRDGLVQFHRVAVGEHLILGGDNFDLALAHHLEQRLKPGGQLEPRQWSVLVRSCRQLKEVLMGDNAPDSWTLTLPGSGSKLIGGSIQVPVQRSEAESILAEGFFPEVPFDAKPVASASGFQEFGLPYAPDPAITKYLATFLSSHRFESDGESPPTTDEVPSGGQASHPPEAEPPLAILFNGGVFGSPLLRRRLIQSLEQWFRRPGSHWSPTELENDRLDLAVARGAAYYGMVRRGEGVRIAAGLARTYYIGVERSVSAPADAAQASSNRESPLAALCLLPAGIEPGQEVDLTHHQFELRVSQPIEFPLYVSSTRLTDRPGDLLAVDPEQIKALPPIRTVLKTGKSKEADTVTVILKARLTEIGTLDLWCSEVDGKRTWKLLFDVRSTTQTDLSAHDAAGERQGLFDEELVQSAKAVIRNSFGLEATDQPRKDPPVSNVAKRLVEVLKLEREEWPTSLLRQLWDALIEAEGGRRLSADHEARWLNLTGYALRPGYGLAVDDWRCNETWKLLQGKLLFATTAVRAEWYILWRRVAGGLTTGQQQSLAAPLISQIRQAVRNPAAKSKSAGFGTNTHESAELVRLLGACELLPVAHKRELGDLLLEMLGRPRFAALASATYWALGRIGARRPVYGPLNSVVPADVAARWLKSLAELDLTDSLAAFAVMQMGRRTGDRYRDIDEATRTSVLQTLKRAGVPRHYRDLIAEVGNLESEEQALVMGDSLPKGLRIL
ncbi:Hsp70 family protein [Schlesneria sp.]|uniref:Hsp70 family protein n=1 Tax=Schlesneria sp. TaxID=2762018 RepID=UPI002EEB7F9E